MGWRMSCAGLLAFAGCGLFGDAGDLVGEMSVEVALQENSCGSAVGEIPETTTTEVKLYERDGLLTWSGSLGSFQADIDEDGNFVARSSSSQVLRGEEPDGWGGVRAACVVDATEEIRGKLTRRVPEESDAADGGGAEPDAGEVPHTPARVSATDTLQVAATPGADCSDFVGLGSGLFASLPCRVLVELTGSE